MSKKAPKWKLSMEVIFVYRIAIKSLELKTENWINSVKLMEVKKKSIELNLNWQIEWNFIYWNWKINLIRNIQHEWWLELLHSVIFITWCYLKWNCGNVVWEDYYHATYSSAFPIIILWSVVNLEQTHHI